MPTGCAHISWLMTFGVAGQDDDTAPFGLAWMVSAEEITELGVVLTPVDMSGFGTSYLATNLPKALSDIETVVLSFGYTDELWRVAAISTEFENDSYGTAVRSRYSEIERSLEKSYTAGQKYHRPSTDSYYGKAENFTYSIDQNEANWFSTYTSLSADIELSIGAASTRDSFWRLIYSHRAGEAAFKAGKSDLELDAL
ncbi:hypothetical protein [Devosia sp. Root635]|uniref:hypothetical protein n=1 Tax=Devosia sp. Root635 TaxID=1736575 RepID=UPI00138F6B8C|nr:hypothetical protein [Devosia sp. Root635]